MIQAHAASGSFADIAGEIAGKVSPPEEIRRALQALGEDAGRVISTLPPEKRAELVDRFIRNLRSLGVAPATELHHRFLASVDAEPRGSWTNPLRDPVSIVELRNHIKYVLTALGLPWSAIAKLQAGICGLGRWIVSSGGGEVGVSVERRTVRFLLTMASHGLEDALLERSPISAAVKDSVDNFHVAHADTQVRFEFIVRA